MPYVIKAAISDANARRFSFPAHKTMYRGRDVGEKDEIFIFSSEKEGGVGLIARGVVNSVAAVQAAPAKSKRRSTPRVSIVVRRVATTNRRLGRAQLRAYDDWDDGRPETELCFNLYRQATDKIAGISESTALFLRRLF